MPSITTILDVRPIPVPRKHPTIMETFDRLEPGEGFILVNDHDPKPLYYHFAAERAGRFEWRYLEEGPEVWRVEISKLGAPKASHGQGCCGHGQTPTAILKGEHRLIERVLNALEAQVAGIARGAGPDGATLAKTVEFIRTFADKCHHGKEEGILFPALVEHGIPKEMGPVGVMLHEHEIGRQFVRGLAKGVESLGADSEAVALIRENAVGYIRLLRDHIQKEDGILFNMADGILGESEQRALAKRFEQFEEEETGLGVHDRMLKLLAEIEGASGGATETLDVRPIPVAQKHPTIFKKFEALKPGEAFILVNDHDPKPLYYQFAAERSGQFGWRYLEEGPEVWRVEISKAR